MNGESDRLLRPALMVKAARFAARAYNRRRDLPGAVAGLLARPEAEILPTLRRAEAQHEALRHHGAPAYRPAHHLQVLAALIAECRAAGAPLAGAAGEVKRAGHSATLPRPEPVPDSDEASEPAATCSV